MSKEGTIKWYDDEWGKGYITPDDGSDDVLIKSDVVEAGYVPDEDDRVYYEAVKKHGELVATKVRRSAH